MKPLLEQEQGGVLLPGQLFRPGKMNARPGYFKAAPLDHFSQVRLSINVEMPSELFQDGLHVSQATESTVEILTEADRIPSPQILPAETAGQFQYDALQEKAIRRQRLATAVFPIRIKVNMQVEEGLLQEQPLGIGEMGRSPSLPIAQFRAAQIRVQII
jgi:hypothetical protein